MFRIFTNIRMSSLYPALRAKGFSTDLTESFSGNASMIGTFQPGQRDRLVAQTDSSLIPSVEFT